MFRNLVRLYPLLLLPVLAYLWQCPLEAFVVHRPVGQFVTLGGQRTNFLSSSTKYPIVSSIYSYENRPIYSHPHLLLQSSILTADLVETATNVLVGIGGVVVLLTVLTFAITTYIVPTAARQIEDLAKQLDPELWREYEQKLEPGETLVMRPELMQELGTKVIELQSKLLNDDVDEWEASHRKVAEVETIITPEVVTEELPIATTASETRKNPSETEGSINVEVIAKNKWED